MCNLLQSVSLFLVVAFAALILLLILTKVLKKNSGTHKNNSIGKDVAKLYNCVDSNSTTDWISLRKLNDNKSLLRKCKYICSSSTRFEKPLKVKDNLNWQNMNRAVFKRDYSENHSSLVHNISDILSRDEQSENLTLPNTSTDFQLSTSGELSLILPKVVAVLFMVAMIIGL